MDKGADRERREKGKTRQRKTMKGGTERENQYLRGGEIIFPYFFSVSFIFSMEVTEYGYIINTE